MQKTTLVTYRYGTNRDYNLKTERDLMSARACTHAHTHIYIKYIYIYIYVCVYTHTRWRNSHQWAVATSISKIHDHTQTHHTRYDSSGRVIGKTQRLLPNNTQPSQEPDIHAPSGIRTPNPSKRAAADPGLRPRGHWYRRNLT